MSKNTPFFNNFIEADTLTEEEANQISGGTINFGGISTRKAPSDDDEGFAIATRKAPSDDDEGFEIATRKAPSDDDEGTAIVFPTW
ncbi:microviridin/marinostatin family tricyclic proteinase inhibitor [Vibrio penaeicida]|uniref:microviridin/marinostatin family tricyclic proteinase inhibitor n=1 Tax=Vibrio penaeicida TaxID=104609 RepID=UPI000CE9C831|nr:microviridin/marinostatin family tricyclic proteinase inhibitor [Vibrio penaeicida]MDP2574534.1 microviridin/marinostatin family tricyclic proteinase inhibitor [Vibrio penaeicida]